MLGSPLQLVWTEFAAILKCKHPATTDAGVHNTPEFGKDLNKIVSVLKEEDVLEPKLARCHDTFSLKKSLLQTSIASRR